MDSQFLAYYNRELAYLKEMGKEFAEQYPKIAGRLGMHGIEVADPYVERLLEGFSFLTARIHLKMDAEFPTFTQNLLDVINPNYTSPLPSMVVNQVLPSMTQGNLAQGYHLERGDQLRQPTHSKNQQPIIFTTAHAMTLWPVEISQVRLGTVPADVPLLRLNQRAQQASPQSALRVRFTIRSGAKLQESDFDQLMFYIAGQDIHTHQLLELILTHTTEVICHDVKRPMGWKHHLDANCIKHEGFDNEQSLLPNNARVFQGYRVLQEYFAFPARFMFFSVKGLARAMRIAASKLTDNEELNAFELTFLFDKRIPELEGIIGIENLLLHCVPVINLFEKNTDRLEIKQKNHEYHIVPDRTKPLDYEIYSVLKVRGATNAAFSEPQDFRPFYASLSQDNDNYRAYYAVRRSPRVVSSEAEVNGTRTSYLGSEVYVSLVDQQHVPYNHELTHLGIETLCTNRDLPLLLSKGTTKDLEARSSVPAEGCTFVAGPTRPRRAIAETENSWRLISQLGINYLSLIDMDAEQGAETLRQMLHVYAGVADPSIAQQIQAIRSINVEPMNSRLPVPGPIVYGRGARITLEVDENGFSGISPFLFGAILEHFFARHVSINMMTELTLKSQQRGVIHRWSPRAGNRPVL